MRTQRFVLLAVALLALSIGIAACGGGSSKKSNGAGSDQASGQNGKKGGTLTVLNVSDFEYADPGAAYYQFDYMVDYATQRPLYYYRPDQTTQPPTPDLAAGPWQISPDAK